MSYQRYSDDVSKRDIPSFIEPRPPLVDHPFKRPKPQKGMNLLEFFEEDSELEEPELVQVYLRLKPCKKVNTLYEVRSDTCLVTSLDTATAGHGRRTQHNVSKMYKFTRIFEPNCDQKAIFEQVVKNNLSKLPEGHNFTLLTYGASGSGKTYTVMGTVGSPGLVPRSLEYVFKLVDAAQQPLYKPSENGAMKLDVQAQRHELQWVKQIGQETAPHQEKYRRMSVRLHNDLTISSADLSNRAQYYVWVSFIEIYNEAVYDLLAPLDKRIKLAIREDSSGNTFVKGSTQVFVRSGEEAYNVMAAGKLNLVVAATGVHSQSSRSHCIFTISLLKETAGSVRTSCVRLCDLAGCERARATRNTGKRMQESRAINSSLHVLERCLHILRKNQKSNIDSLVPYRESKLTRLLGSGLSGTKGEAVSMVVTLNTSSEYAHETKHVLGLASVAQDIQISNTMLESRFEASSTCTQESTVHEYSTDMLRLRAENERLHFELHQAENRCKQLSATIAEMQRTKASEMFEVMEEAKDITEQYFKTEIKILKSQKQAMQEEYEDKLRTERLARKRAEEKLESIICNNCKTDEEFKETKLPEDVVVLSDSDRDSEDECDPLNESLEPTFKSKNPNESISLHTMDDIREEDDGSDDEIFSTSSDDSGSEQNKDENESATDKTINHNVCLDSATSATNIVDEKQDNQSVKEAHDNDIILKYDTVDTDNESESEVDDGIVDNGNKYNDEIEEDKEIVDNDKEDNENKNESSISNCVDEDTYFASISNQSDDKSKKSIEQLCSSSHRGTYYVSQPPIEVSHIKANDVESDRSKQNNDIPQGSNEKSINILRGTYFINSDDSEENNDICSSSKAKFLNTLRGTYFVNSNESKQNNDIHPSSKEKNINSLRGTYFVSSTASIMSQDIENRDEVKADFKELAMNEQSGVSFGIVNTPNKEICLEPQEQCNKLNRGTYYVSSTASDVCQNLKKKFEPVIKSNAKLFGTDNTLHDDICQQSVTKGNNSSSLRGTYFISSSALDNNTDNNNKGQRKEVAKEPILIHPSTDDIVERSMSVAKNDNLLSSTYGDSNRVINVPQNIDGNNEVKKSIFKQPITKPTTEVIYEKYSTCVTEDIGKALPKPPSAKATQNLVKKLIKSSTLSQDSDSSLRQFEQLEKAMKKIDNEEALNRSMQSNQSVFNTINVTKGQKFYFDIEPNTIAKESEGEKRVCFDNIDQKNDCCKGTDETKDIDGKPSPVKDDFERSKIKELLRESFTKPEIITSARKARLAKQHESVDLFDSPITFMAKGDVDIETATESIERLVLNQQSNETVTCDTQTKSILKKAIKQTTLKDAILEKTSIDISPDKKVSYDILMKKDVTETVTEQNDDNLSTKFAFGLSVLNKINNEMPIDNGAEKDAHTSVETKKVNQIINKEIKLESLLTDKPNQDIEIKKQESSIDHGFFESHSVGGDNTLERFDKIYEDISVHRTTEFDLLVSRSINKVSPKIEKDESKYNLRKRHNNSKSTKVSDDVFLASSETKQRTRSMRLRRQRKQDYDLEGKLKDIGNLQKEFSDVTMDVPAAPKVVKDIPSSERGSEENVHPLDVIQSCSESITRSRRKLFTPRAEPLEESLTQTENSNERLYVPRPSYHRPRARRKL